MSIAPGLGQVNHGLTLRDCRTSRPIRRQVLDDTVRLARFRRGATQDHDLVAGGLQGAPRKAAHESRRAGKENTHANLDRLHEHH